MVQQFIVMDQELISLLASFNDKWLQPGLCFFFLDKQPLPAVPMYCSSFEHCQGSSSLSLKYARSFLWTSCWLSKAVVREGWHQHSVIFLADVWGLFPCTFIRISTYTVDGLKIGSRNSKSVQLNRKERTTTWLYWRGSIYPLWGVLTRTKWSIISVQPAEHLGKCWIIKLGIMFWLTF